ncbi:MAG: hypothetical protein WC315_00550 [Candidatus Omnitrophota bacterium]|jgi:hypothetical protein
MNYEWWDVGEEQLLRGAFPNFGKTSTSKIMQALIQLDGQMTSSIVFGDNNMRAASRSVVYRIALPEGKRSEFEQLTGYACSLPRKVHVN